MRQFSSPFHLNLNLITLMTRCLGVAIGMTLAVPAALAQPGSATPGETPPTSPMAGVPRDLPEALRLPGEAPATPTLKATARGYQIYVCQAEANKPSRYAWVLKAPEATLYSPSGQKNQAIGQHYQGPTWKSIDGSAVAGKITAKVNQLNTIPWLLLKAEAHKGRNGIFSDVQWIQRLNTEGGLAPQKSCNQSIEGQEVSIAYSADYYFYKPSTE